MVANEIGSAQVDVFVNVNVTFDDRRRSSSSRWITSSSSSEIASVTSVSASESSSAMAALVSPSRSAPALQRPTTAPPPPPPVSLVTNSAGSREKDRSQLRSSNFATTEAQNVGVSVTDECSSTSSSSPCVFSATPPPPPPPDRFFFHQQQQKLTEKDSSSSNKEKEVRLPRYPDEDVVSEVKPLEPPTSCPCPSSPCSSSSPSCCSVVASHGDSGHSDSDAIRLKEEHTESVEVASDAAADDSNREKFNPMPSRGSTEDADDDVAASQQHAGGTMQQQQLPLKSALKRTVNRSGGGGASLTAAERMQLQQRKKLRVKFNEALNTFLECDYVIYVDDDEFDLLYHLDAVAAAAAAAAAAADAAASQPPPQLVNVRSFDLQLPETTSSAVAAGPISTASAPCVSYTQVAGSTGAAPLLSLEPVTLSPPDGYKDAAAFYAAATAALVNLGCGDEDHWPEEYDDEEEAADEIEPEDDEAAAVNKEENANGWTITTTTTTTTPPQPDASVVVEPTLPDPPRTGILKGGKLWRGASTASANANSSSSSSSCSVGTSSTTAQPSASSAAATGEENSTSDKPVVNSTPASVRFVHLNDAPPDDENDPGSSGHSSGSKGGSGSGHNSAFQQLFPRARKLLQDLPEAEIQRLTATARAAHQQQQQQQHASADLKYEKAMRVTEAASAALELQQHQAAIYYGAQSLPAVQAALLRRIEAKQQHYHQQQQQQKRSDPPTTSDSLVERLKWLTTTDDDDQDERSIVGTGTGAGATSGATDVVREAADGISDPEMSQQIGAVSVGVHQVQQQATAEEETATSSASVSASISSSNPPAKPPKPSGAEKSTYRKLNELFFRSKSKDKSKESSSSNNSQQPTSPNEWKSASVMALNRSFSPPPPAEVEPSKMRPSGSKKGPNHLHHHHHHHLIHLVGLPGSPMPGAPTSELLGRIPNVVPTVDHVYRAAVDLVTRNEAYGAQTYGLDDIDAALRQAGHHLHPSAAGVIVGDDLTGRDDVASSGGGSRSSGSSGDSGLGSHETSLASGSDVAEAAGTSSAMSTSSSSAANDELQAFVRQDATQSRIDRIKKRYSAALEDEAEDYGFLRRPSVRGIKTRFGSTSEIMQQMQAQLAPPAGTAVVVSSSSANSSSSGTPSSTWSYLDAGSMQAQALLDPRDKRRSALVMVSSNNGNAGGNSNVMSNSVHLPALPEDAYFQTQPGATPAVSSSTVRPGQHTLMSRPSSVMNIYGSTGDLYQHLRAPRPVAMQPMMHQQQRMLHAASSSSSASPSVGLPPSYTMTMQQQQQQHILERTSSVSSALDGGSSSSSVIYGTIRRQPMMMPMYNPQQQHPVESLSSPTRGDYPPGMTMMAHQQQLQQPLRMTMSTPVSTATGAYLPGSNQQPPPRPINNLVHPTSHGVYAGTAAAGGPIGYLPVQDYHHQYATLPAKRQSPYGVPSQQQQQQQHQLMLDPARYRQVLPAAPLPSPLHNQQQQQPVHHLRPASAMMMHDPAAAAIRQSAPPPLPPAPLKDEREGPEGASSSPGLNHHDVSM